jgi:hypothetical protein
MMSRLFGPDCEFISTSFANFDGTQAMVDKMIVKIRELAVQTSQAPQKRRKL